MISERRMSFPDVDFQFLIDENVREFRAKIPPRHAGATLTDFDPKVQQGVNGWFAQMSPGTLFLAGAPGTGKTRLAWAIGLAALHEGYEGVLVVDYVGLLNDLRSGVRDGGVGAVVDRCAKAEVLIVDDIGASSGSEWSSEQFGRIIDIRWEFMRRTVVTTNLTKDALEREIGERAADRLAQGNRSITMKGQSRRR